MALRDYAEENEDEYYGQEFAQDGKVSLWIAPTDLNHISNKADLLQDLCGVGYYDLDFHEVVGGDQVGNLSELFGQLSYSESFRFDVLQLVSEQEIYYLMAQYDFAYSESRVSRTPTGDLRFVGVFDFQKEAI